MLLKYFPPKNKHGNESTDVGQPANKQTKIMKNLYNTTEGVRFDVNVDIGFETKKMKMESTQMLYSEGYIIG